MARQLAYRTLLRLLPTSFRAEFADEMVTVFADERNRVRGLAALSLWWRTAIDVVTLAGRLRADQLWLDLTYAVRGLNRQKTYAVATMATLALALGPATGAFTIMRHVLLDPLPGVDTSRLVYAWVTNPVRNAREFPWSELNFLDQHERRRGVMHMAAFTTTGAAFGGDRPQQLLGAWVSSEMLDVLGIAPARGRGFTLEDMAPNRDPVIVLTDDLARRRFGDGGGVGETLVVDGRVTTVVGVLPAGLRFPAATTEFWQPLIIDRATSARGSSYLSVMARLEDGATPASVQETMNLVAADLERDYPSINSNLRVEVVPAATQLTAAARKVVPVLGLATAAVFLLAAASIASLTIVRTSSKRAEFATRIALGASRTRLTRQLIVEQFVIAIAAGAVALGAASAMLA